MLLVTTSYPDENEGSAGAGVFVRDFAEEFVRQGVDIEVVSPSSRNSLRIEKGVRVRRFAVPRQPLSLLNPAAPGHWGAILKTLSNGSSAVMNACTESTPNHILALWSLPSGAWARIACRRFGIGYSTWSLGSDIWSLSRIPVVRSVLNRVLLEALNCFADGYQLAADVEKLSGRNCVFLPSCRNLSLSEHRILRHTPPYRLSFLGRWHMNKGVDLLIDALELLDDQDWARIESVRIDGGGPLEQDVRSRLKRIAESGKPVVAGGYLDQSAAIQLLQQTDYLLLPSRIESIPVVFSDALKMHCAVVANPVGDLPTLFGHYCVGELALHPTAKDFSDGVRRILLKSPCQFEKNIIDAGVIFDVANSVKKLRDICLGAKCD